LPPGFLKMEVESIVLGNALLMSVENESMIMRLVFWGRKFWVGWERRAMR
jgi:hypothetical protein